MLKDKNGQIVVGGYRDGNGYKLNGNPVERSNAITNKENQIYLLYGISVLVTSFVVNWN